MSATPTNTVDPEIAQIQAEMERKMAEVRERCAHEEEERKAQEAKKNAMAEAKAKRKCESEGVAEGQKRRRES